MGFRLALIIASITVYTPHAAALEFTNATIRIEVEGETPVPMKTAAHMLSEEVQKRSGFPWMIGRNTEGQRSVTLTLAAPGELPAEGFRIEATDHGLTITGADPTGVVFGVGWLLRHFTWGPEYITLDAALPVESAPAYPLRGHQLGYRNKANSYDAWDVAQYDQYIRELAIFGTNAIENIPFQDETPSVHMTVPRNEMNVRLSEICAKYGLQYWVWTPATYDLRDEEQRAADLDKHEALYAACPQLDGVFFPGGDPGNNHPREVMPFLADLAGRLAKHHPESRVWISLQGFDDGQIDYFYDWLGEHGPDWLGGVVAGPSSPPIIETRRRLPARYAIRHYPDITHTIRCQYEVKWWDPAYALTLGREPTNPQPAYYAFIHNYFAPYTSGFITYSDGMHDDVNKMVWSLRGWDPHFDVRDMLIAYARFFFPGAEPATVADALLALEKNWEGPLDEHGGVSATRALWDALAQANPALADNWRWQQCLLRASYDAYTRLRLIHERDLEGSAMAQLREALDAGEPEAGMRAARETLARAGEHFVAPALREQIFHWCDRLFARIGLQTSVPRYDASGYERGAVLDFVDLPLNNRWWLEDQFDAIAAHEDEAAQTQRLREIATWTHNDPPRAFYDNIGWVGQCPRLVRQEGLGTDPTMQRDQNPTMWKRDDGFSRDRLSWLHTLEFPMALRYEGLDPEATYEFRMRGYGEAKPHADGAALEATTYETGIGGLKVFPVPPTATADGTVEIHFEALDEDHLNWRNKSRIAEAWLVAVE